MIQVKEFLTDDNTIDKDINEWLKENDGKIEMKDIKYSMSNSDANNTYCSGALVIYKVLLKEQMSKHLKFIK